MAGGAPEIPISARPFLRGGEEIAWLHPLPIEAAAPTSAKSDLFDVYIGTK
jgi:hypothetical protein